MNKYTSNLNRLEFLVTLACSGRCKHCSEGDHSGKDEHLSPETASQAVRELSGVYKLDSVMTFGGEPMLFPETVYAVHRTAKEVGIPKRQLITNGFFSKDSSDIRCAAEKLTECGVNDILLSVDAFHQETIPLEPVKIFAQAVLTSGGDLRTSPAWLVDKNDNNKYNLLTREILAVFSDLGIKEGEGNIIFPDGNALKYLGEYFDDNAGYHNPYEEDPFDLRSISVEPNGAVLGGNLRNSSIVDIIENYRPDAK